MTSPKFWQIIAGVFLFFYLPMLYWYGSEANFATSIDYPSYYYAAQLTFTHDITPYGFEAFSTVPLHLGQRVNPYLYPPPSLLAFWPLSKLSIDHGFTAFLILSHVCFLWSVWLMLTRILPSSRTRHVQELTIVISLVYLFCSDAITSTFWTGQINLIALFFICAAIVGLKRGSAAWLIGLPLSIAVLLKTYPVLLLLPILLRKRYQAAALTVGFFLLLTAISAFVLPVEVWSTWLTRVMPFGGYASHQIGAGSPWNQSISGFVTRLPLPTQSSKVMLATLLAFVVLSATVYYSFRASRQSEHKQSADDQIAAFLLAIYLIAPLSWDHHIVYVFPAAVLAISLLMNDAARGTTAVLVTFALLLMAWRLRLDHPALTDGWWRLLMSTKFYAVLALWLFYIGRLRNSGSSPPFNVALSS